MRKNLLIVVSLLTLFLCGCNSLHENKVSESNVDGLETTATDSSIEDLETTTTGSSEENINVYSEDFDGIVLTVSTDKKVYALKSIINVKATVRNNTGKTIGLFVPTSDNSSHYAIQTLITADNHNYLIDTDTFGKGFDDAVSVIIIEPGKEYVQEMRFETYCNSNRAPASKGVYTGTSVIRVTDPYGSTDSEMKYSLNFCLSID